MRQSAFDLLTMELSIECLRSRKINSQSTPLTLAESRILNTEFSENQNTKRVSFGFLA